MVARLPTFSSSAQVRHSKRMCRTVYGPPALAPIYVGLLDGVEVGTEADLSRSHLFSFAYPGRMPSRNRFRPCFAVSQEVFHSLRRARRTAVFVPLGLVGILALVAARRVRVFPGGSPRLPCLLGPLPGCPALRHVRDLTEPYFPSFLA